MFGCRGNNGMAVLDLSCMGEISKSKENFVPPLLVMLPF